MPPIVPALEPAGHARPYRVLPGLVLQSELYGESYRPFATIRKPLLLASGARDVGAVGVMDTTIKSSP